MITVEELEQRFPETPWREPLDVSWIDGLVKHYACRICLAQKGLKGPDVALLPIDREEVVEHIRTEHAQPATPNSHAGS